MSSAPSKTPAIANDIVDLFTIVKQEAPRVARWMRLQVEADDLASAVLLQLWSQHRAGEALALTRPLTRGYVIAALRNEAHDALRRERRHIMKLERATRESSDVVDETALRGSDVAFERLVAVASELDAEERILVRALFVDQKSIKELASEVGVTPEAIRSRLHRLRRRLVALFPDVLDDEKTRNNNDLSFFSKR